MPGTIGILTFTELALLAAATMADEQKRDGSSKNHNKYRKDKPWDSEGINHWKVEVTLPILVVAMPFVVVSCSDSFMIGMG